MNITSALLLFTLLSGGMVSSMPQSQMIYPYSPMQYMNMNSRTFFPFNLVSHSLQSKILLKSRVTALETAVQVNKAVQDVKNMALMTKDTELEEKITECCPGCPASAIGAHRIGDYCYTVETAAADFLTSSNNCMMKGGYLAEPTATAAATTAFYTSLKAHFVTEIGIIEGVGNECYIGLRRMVSNDPFYSYMHSGQLVGAGDAIFVGNVDVLSDLIAATINVPGGANLNRAVTGIGANDLPTDAFCSFCQYDLVSPGP